MKLLLQVVCVKIDVVRMLLKLVWECFCRGYVEQGFFLCILFLCSSSSSFVLNVIPQHSYFSFFDWQQGIFCPPFGYYKFWAYKSWVILFVIGLVMFCGR